MRIATLPLLLATLLPGAALADPGAEPLAGRMLSELERIKVYVCDHGAEQGATVVAVRELRAPEGGLLLEGVANWRGAQVTKQPGHTQFSLRHGHNFVFVGPGQGRPGVRPMRGVIEGDAVEGTCRDMEDAMIALYADAFVAAQADPEE
jgi:hypothetical protein